MKFIDIVNILKNKSSTKLKYEIDEYNYITFYYKNGTIMFSPCDDRIRTTVTDCLMDVIIHIDETKFCELLINDKLYKNIPIPNKEDRIVFTMMSDILKS